MFNSKYIKYTMVSSALVALLAGCGSSSDSGSSVQEVEFRDVSRVGTENLESGREISIKTTLDSTYVVEDGLAVSYFLIDDSIYDVDDGNETELETQVYLGGTILNVVKGTVDYHTTFTIPADLETDDYKLFAYVVPTESTDANSTISFTDDETFEIVANDGEADIKIIGLTLNESEEVAIEDNSDANMTTLASLRTLRTLRSDITSPLITFDIGQSDSGSIMLNDNNISFHGTLTLKSEIADANNTGLSACIDLGEGCEKIPFYITDDDNKTTLEDVLTIDVIDTESNTEVLIDAVITKEILINMVKKALEGLDISGLIAGKLTSDDFQPKFRINVESINNENIESSQILYEHDLEFSPTVLSNESMDTTYDILGQLNENNISVGDLSEYNLSEYLTADQVSMVNYYLDGNLTALVEDLNLTVGDINSLKSVNRSLRGKKATKKVFSKTFEKNKYGSKFGAGVKLYGKAELNKDGAFSYVDGTVKTKVLGYRFNFLEAKAEASVVPASFTNTGYDAYLKFVGKNVYSSSLYGEVVNYHYNKSFTKTKGYSQTIFVSIVPVTVEAGASGTLALDIDVKIPGVYSLDAEIIPSVDVGAYVKAGVGVSAYSAGVYGDLIIVKEDFQNTASAALTYKANDYIEGTLRENITNIFTGPKGSTGLYATYTKAKWCKKWGVKYPCGTKEVTKKKSLAKFKTKRSKKTLLNKKQKAFKINL